MVLSLKRAVPFFRGGYPCVVLASCFHVPPEWLGVVSLPSLFNHSVHMLVLCFPYLPSTIFLEVPIVPQVAVFLGLLEESFIPSQEFLDVLANPRVISVSPAEC